MAENNDLKKLTSLTPILRGDMNSFSGTLSNNLLLTHQKTLHLVNPLLTLLQVI